MRANEDISRYLGEIARLLTLLLVDTLPKLSDNWWKTLVFDNLSYPQLQLVNQKNITELKELDLSALLRVLDKNWYQVSQEYRFTHDDRHFFKEMVSVRNRWAHISQEGFDKEDIYRDFDTIQRLLSLINADEVVINEIKQKKNEVLHENEPVRETQINKTAPLQNNDGKNSKFTVPQMVFAKTKPDIIGPIISVIPGEPETRYMVFLNNKQEILYESQIQLHEKKEEYEQVNLEQFHSYLTALQIKYPGLSTLYSLNAARVDFVPYQFKPVFRFIKSDRPRLLIADSVGVGKTIEAGLILKELQSRKDVQSILIICPRALITERKWYSEMMRFGEEFVDMDGPNLRYCIAQTDLTGEWPTRFQKTIIPYSLLDETALYGNKKTGKIGLLDIEPKPHFDLVIVDEAHHIRNTNTYSHKIVRYFCDNADAVLFLTATPIQLGDEDLFVLLNTLRPDFIRDMQSFVQMSEPNPYINEAVSAMRTPSSDWAIKAKNSLNKAVATAWGQSTISDDPDFINVVNQLENDNIIPEERVKMITIVENLHTFSRIINRTRRRDIDNFTIRHPETRNVEFTPAQKVVHDKLLEIQADIFTRLHSTENVKFMMTTIRRQAASCIHGLVPFLNAILNRHLSELFWLETNGDEENPSQENTLSVLKADIENIISLAKSLGPEDPKFESLLKTIEEKQDTEKTLENGAKQNRRIMLFSSFRHTLQYLYDKLFKAGYKVGMVHGETPVEERRNLKSRLENKEGREDNIDILLFSEIGCEGLDYQFCDCMINYDLPWNPMRIEQRIGRIDRRGQKSESVAIVNMITPGTVDADIYERCMKRIGVFNRSLGESEVILGEITKELKNIAEQYNLSEDERRKKLEQLADNKVRQIQAQEELENTQSELFGIRLPQEQLEKDIEDATNYWLSATSIQRITSQYLQKISGKKQEYFLGDNQKRNFRRPADPDFHLLSDFKKIHRENTKIYRDWEKWLKESNPNLPVTFESACAMQNPDTVFLMPLHPLVKQAAAAFELNSYLMTKLIIKSKDVPAGQYFLAVYQWQILGIKEDEQLILISDNDILTNNITKLIKSAIDWDEGEIKKINSDVMNKLDILHHRLWEKARAEHKTKNAQIVNYMRQSLATSHKAQLSLLNDQLNMATEEKIIRMRQGQIDNAVSDYNKRIQDLDIAGEKSDIISRPVAFGVLKVLSE
ncbi:hypothetical protein AGMMS50293_21760 [Spirochaetia bacterium]|nr:hypothetical protein AGMMS50293_21760 [Spirochaetia bacterium]